MGWRAHGFPSPGGAEPPGRGVGDVPPFRPNPLAPFPARKGGKFGGVLPTSGTPKRRQTLSQRGWARGSKGHSPLAGGVGGVPPQNQKRERGAHISKPATSGTQNAGKPSANGGGQKGVEGAQAPWQGVWGMCPLSDLTPWPPSLRGKGENLAGFSPRVGPKTLVNPQPTGVGKGVQGAQPPGRESGGCAPRNRK